MLATQEFLLFDIVQHVQRELGKDRGMVESRIWNASCHHIGISRHLNFLHAIFIHEFIEVGKYFIEHIYHFTRTKACRNGCKVDDIRKQDSGRIEFLSDGFTAQLELFSDPFWQDVIEELICLITLGLDGVFLQEIPAGISFKVIASEHTNHIGTQKEKIMHGKNNDARLGGEQLFDDNAPKFITEHNHQVRQDRIPEAQARQTITPHGDQD